jgi:hypothetical protein
MGHVTTEGRAVFLLCFRIYFTVVWLLDLKCRTFTPTPDTFSHMANRVLHPEFTESASRIRLASPLTHRRGGKSGQRARRAGAAYQILPRCAGGGSHAPPRPHSVLV